MLPEAARAVKRFQQVVSAQNDNVLLVPNRNVLLTQARWGVGNGPTPDDAERARPAGRANAERTAQRWIAPGYIDLQVNGIGGFDYNRPDLPYTYIASFHPVLICNRGHAFLSCDHYRQSQ